MLVYAIRDSMIRGSASLAIVLGCLLAVEAGHASNWAVIVSTSRFWYNYRHVANALAVYHTVVKFASRPSH